MMRYNARMSEDEYRAAWVDLLKSERNNRSCGNKSEFGTSEKIFHALELREMTTSDIAVYLGIPRTTACSGVMRLLRAGRVSVDRVDGINIYRLRGIENTRKTKAG